MYHITKLKSSLSHFTILNSDNLVYCSEMASTVTRCQSSKAAVPNHFCATDHFMSENIFTDQPLRCRGLMQQSKTTKKRRFIHNPVPNDSRTGTGPWAGGWGLLQQHTFGNRRLASWMHSQKHINQLCDVNIPVWMKISENCLL